MPGVEHRQHRAIANLVKLNTNEGPLAPSPLALEAMRAAAVDTLRLYPDPEAQELREALAVHHGIKPEQVFVGNGRRSARACIRRALETAEAAAVSGRHLQLLSR